MCFPGVVIKYLTSSVFPAGPMRKMNIKIDVNKANNQSKWGKTIGGQLPQQESNQWVLSVTVD